MDATGAGRAHHQRAPAARAAASAAAAAPDAGAAAAAADSGRQVPHALRLLTTAPAPVSTARWTAGAGRGGVGSPDCFSRDPPVVFLAPVAIG